MDSLYRLAIIHRNRLFRECLVSALTGMEEYLAASLDHRDLRWPEQLQQYAPQVVVIDSRLGEPAAAQVAACVRMRLDRAKIIVVGSANGQDGLFECLKAGIEGCVHEESSLGELHEAIGQVGRGGMFCSPQLTFDIFRRFSVASCASCLQTSPPPVALSRRELEIVRLISEGLSNKQIARKLCLSLYTVKNHVHNLLGKLSVGDRLTAVQYVRRHCLFTT